MNENKNRATFQSRLGFILVSAGCAIGLGNVWKFPYICGQNGGGAFLFLYLICLVLLGLPILICEFAIGRGSNRSLSQAFNRLEKPGSRYHCTKYTSIAGNYLLMMFYTMVTGWMLYYAFKYALARWTLQAQRQRLRLLRICRPPRGLCLYSRLSLSYFVSVFAHWDCKTALKR